MAKPLDGLRVLDFSHALAGPYCTMLLGMYGADVVKVEGLQAQDMGRTWGPPFQGGHASYFLGLNSNKSAAAIDLKHPDGVELCLQLAAQADVLIENMRPGSMERLGLGYEAVKARNPKIVYCSISGYGQTGPSRDEPAMDLILQASCGLISVTGTPDGRTARCGHSVADITSGMFALSGILMALRVRDHAGHGQFIDVSMLDSMISAMASNYATFLGSGTVPKPLGTAFSTIVPYAAFPTADRDIAIAVASEKLWAAFCRAIEQPAWIADPRYNTNALRVKNRATLEPAITAIFQTQAASHWMERLRAHGIPVTPVRTLAEVAADPQAEARDMFPVLDHPDAGPIAVTGAPIKFSETPGQVSAPAPRTGQHTAEVLTRWLNLDATAIAALRERRILG